MTDIALVYAANKRLAGRFPELIMRNAMVEAAPSNAENPRSIMRRPATKAFVTVGSGPLRGIFYQAGLLGGDVVVVSATEVYRVASNGAKTLMTGSVTGDNRVRMAGGRDADLNDVVYIATGTELYKMVSNTVTAENFPDATQPGCQDIEVHRGFIIGIQANSQQCYFQVPGDTTWDALSFASAEYKNDPLVGVRTLGDQIYLFGSTTTEVWALTGQADPAIAPYGGLNFDFGCRARDSIVSLESTILWVDDKCLVRMSDGGIPTVISDSGLAEQIRSISAMDLRAWGFTLDGHVFYALTLPGVATWVYDISAQQWGIWDSKGYSHWRAHLGVDTGDTIYAVDSISAAVWTIDPDGQEDADGEVTWEFAAVAIQKEGARDVANVEPTLSVGYGPRSGQGSAPLMGMRYSNNGGHTYSGWKYRSLPLTGVFDRMPRWGPLKPMNAPFGHFYHFKVSDPLVSRVNGVRQNVA